MPLSEAEKKQLDRILKAKKQ